MDLCLSNLPSRLQGDLGAAVVQADGLLRRMLGNTDAASDKGSDVTRLQRWRKVEPLVKSYLGNTLHILGASWVLRAVSATSTRSDGTDLQ